LALHAIAEGRLRAAFGWMALAFLVDGVDGLLARAVGVSEVLPHVDGTLLDNLVDYLNYVVLPAWLIHEAGLVPPGWEPFTAAAICLASAFQFTHVEAKTTDCFFRGFPSYWNVVAFYLVLLRPAPWLALSIVLVLCVLVFAPVRCIYPSRTREHRRLTLTLTVLWALCMVGLLVTYPKHPTWLAYGSLFYPLYYLLLSLKLTASIASTEAGP
jgi:phosphatidylcholine synthase